MIEGLSILPPSASFDAHLPILIAGGGACGLTAALAAVASGAEVAVLERHDRCEGSSAMSLGAICAAGTAEQAAHGIADDAESFLADIMAVTKGRAHPILAKIAAEQSGAAIDWLNSIGVRFELDVDWLPAFGHSRRRMHATPGRSGEDMMARLITACAERDVAIVTQARVSAIFAHDDGRVAGVLVDRPDGAQERYGCDALILATCGFGANTAMVAEQVPSMADARYFGWEGNDGSGIALGMALGGAIANMDAYQGLGLLAEPQGLDVNPKLLLAGGIQVNINGDRFNNEIVDVSGQAARVLAQPCGIAWLIYDERIHRQWGHLGEYRRLLDMGARRSGHCVAELAAATHLPPDTLSATLTEVEHTRHIGATDRFGRTSEAPALEPPFHALKITGALFHTQGGLVVAEDACVLRTDGQPLPNLFAGGGAACSIGGPGGSGYLPGAGLCMAITLGWLAGTNAFASRPSGSRRSAAICAL